MSNNRQRQSEKVHHVASTTFTLDRSYDDLKPIGKGSYGVVCSALSTTLGERVAIKKIVPMSKQVSDAKHVLREIKLMRHMGKHENIVTLYDLHMRETSDELYIIMELLDSDLHRIIQSKQALTEMHYRHFFHQLLSGVKYLHDNRIIHRDLKPGNLLVSKDCRLRITDFGLARERPHGKAADPDEGVEEAMTEHVVTRWYRPPELMLCPDGMYDYSVDMWSCGCILAEMLGRAPLFPGKNFVHQLTLVFDVIGCPIPRDVQHIVNYEAIKFLSTQKDKQRVPFRTLYPNVTPDAWEVLERLMLFNPTKRLTVDETLASAYLAGVGLPASSVFPDTGAEFDFAFEHNAHVTRYQLRQAIAAEVLSFKREMRGEVPVSVPVKKTTPPATAAAAAPVKQQQQEQERKETSVKEAAAAQVEMKNGSDAAKSRASSAPRLRGANGASAPPSAAAAAAAAPAEPVAEPAAAHAASSSRHRVSMKPPLVYQAHKKPPLASAAATVDNSHHHHQQQAASAHEVPSGSRDHVSSSSSSSAAAASNVDSSLDAYDRLFKPKSQSHGSSQPSSAAAAAAAAPLPSSVSAVMERIAKLVEADAMAQGEAAAAAAVAAATLSAAASNSHSTRDNTALSSSATGAKSPARSMRYNPSVSGGSNGRTAEGRTGYEHKSMEWDEDDFSSRAQRAQASSRLVPPDSPLRASKDPSVTVAVPVSSASAAGAPSPGRRSLLDTYLSPRPIAVQRRPSRDETDEPQPAAPHRASRFSPPRAAPEPSKPASPKLSQLYSSLAAGRYEDKYSSDAHAEDRHGLKSAVLASPTRHSASATTAAVRASQSRQQTEAKRGAGSDSSDEDSCVRGGSRLVHAAPAPAAAYTRSKPPVAAAEEPAPRPPAFPMFEERGRENRLAGTLPHRERQQAQEYLSKTYHESSAATAEHRRDSHARAELPVREEPDEEAEEDQPGRKKKFTVAKSPKFSTMSWQRRTAFGGDTTAATAADRRRSTSAMRPSASGAALREEEPEEQRAPPPAPPKKLPSYAQPTSSQLHKTAAVRSESAHRMRK